MKLTLFDDLDPQSVVGGLEDIADELREIASYNECLLDYLDAHEDELAGREHDTAIGGLAIALSE